MVHIGRGETADVDGDFFVRVTHRDESEGPYTLSVNVNPNADVCADDGNEINNTSETAAVRQCSNRACDSWVCSDERRAKLVIGLRLKCLLDKTGTVLIDFSQNEGRLEMNAQGVTAWASSFSLEVVDANVCSSRAVQ